MTNATIARGLESVGEELGAVLDRLAREYEALVTLAAAHREAIRRADADAMRACVQEQTRTLERAQGLDQDRRRVVALAERALGTGRRGAPTTVAEIAAALTEPRRSRLLARGEALRRAMLEYRSQAGSLEAAARALAAHMEGLMRQVGRRLSEAGVYGARGRVEAGVVPAAVVDVRS